MQANTARPRDCERRLLVNDEFASSNGANGAILKQNRAILVAADTLAQWFRARLLHAGG
jgi:hypothetical protein